MQFRSSWMHVSDRSGMRWRQAACGMVSRATAQRSRGARHITGVTAARRLADGHDVVRSFGRALPKQTNQTHPQPTAVCLCCKPVSRRGVGSPVGQLTKTSVLIVAHKMWVKELQCESTEAPATEA